MQIENLKYLNFQEMKEIIDTKVPWTDLKKDSGIVEFYGNDVLSIGISYETNDENQDTYVFNLFCNIDEYVNIGNVNLNNKTIEELVEMWNFYLKLLEMSI